MRLWRAAARLLAVATGLVVALALQQATRGLALVAYVLFLAAVVLALLVARLNQSLPAATDIVRLLPSSPAQQERVEQLENIKRRLATAESTAHDLHFSLRPLVREIVAARLSRGYGIDLDRQPERARAVIGEGRVWEIARPEREPPEDRWAGGWPRRDLEQLIEELEKL